MLAMSSKRRIDDEDGRSAMRLLLSDVDGTLLTSDKRLTDATVAAVHRLHDAGIGFTLTSSRPAPGLGMFVAPLGLTLPLGAFNGGLFCTTKLQPLSRRSVAATIVGPLIDTIIAEGLDAWVYCDGAWLVRDATAPHVERESHVVGFTPTVVTGFDDLIASDHVDEVAKVVGVSDDHDLVARLQNTVREKFGDAASATRSQPYYLDVTNPQANKGAVVDYLAESLRLAPEQIATIGDGQNDTLMFARSGRSIAMGNASADVQAAATFVTGSNDDDGFARAVDSFVLST